MSGRRTAAPRVTSARAANHAGHWARIGVVLVMLGGPSLAAPALFAQQPEPPAAGTEGASVPSASASDPLAALLARAAAEPGEPIDAPPPGLDELGAPTPAPEGGWRELDDVLNRLAAELTAEAARPPRDPASALDAQRLYAAGRLRALDGDPAGAIRDLSSAATLAPTEPAIWHALAQAQSAEGLRTAALDSLHRAVRFGLREPAALLAVARERARAGEHEAAARMLASAITSLGSGADPGLRPVLHGELADPLRALGHELAANQAIARALDLPERFDARTGFRLELAALVRRAPELRRRTGDSFLRLGRAAEALDAYALGAPRGLTGTVWPEADLPRIVHAALLAGQPATAGLVVLSPVAEGRAPLDDDRRALLVHLAENAGLREPILAALGELAVAQTAPTRAARLTLARAAVAGEAGAEAVLLDAASRDPDRAELIDALLAGRPDLAGRVALAGRLASDHPEHGDFYAGRLLVSSGRDPAILDVPPTTPGERVVWAYAALGLGDLARAGEALASLPDDDAGAALARVLIAVELGRWDDARATIGAIAEGTFAHVRALRAVQRLEEAAAAARALVDSGDRSLALRLGLAELLQELNQPDRAASELWSAVEVDPADPRAYDALLRLYGPGGALASQPEQARVLREMGEQCPGALSLRVLAAQRLAEQGLLAEAEARLEALLDSPDSSAAALSALTQVWRSRARTEPAVLDRALALLEARLKAHPRDDATHVARATVLLEKGQPAEAVARLGERLALGPSVSAARMREEVTRAVLGDAAEADRLAIDRLRSSPPTIMNTIALADALARARDPEAREVMRRVHIPGVTLTRGQREALIPAIRAVLSDATRAGADDAAALAALGLGMLDDADAAGIEPGLEAWRTAFHAAVVGGVAPVERFLEIARRMLRVIETPEQARGVLSLYSREPPEADATLDELRAELAYRLAAGLHAEGHEDASLLMYRLALEHDPGHPWANNDLGYFLVERGESLDEAERLLSRAFAASPDEASIVDSLGWLRYRLGVVRDEPGREGAVTLLTRAATLEGGRANATILDHLGDALYRAGEAGGALNAWRRANAAAQRDLTRMPAEAPRAARERAQAEQESIAEKLRALEAGQAPAVAPLIEQDG